MRIRGWAIGTGAGAGAGAGAAAGLIALAAVAGFAFRVPLGDAFFGTPLEQARRSHERKDWSGVVANADRQLARDPSAVEALRLKSRGEARLGEDIAALSTFMKLGGERLEAEDLFLIGRGLIRRNRPGLGRAAFEAASKLDPKHAETRAFLSETKGIHSADSGIERLFAVPSGPALAELILGLATIDPDPETASGPSPLVTRLLRRDRAEFLKLDTPSASRKLLTRLLLEAGRTAEARAWLAKVNGFSTDREANWLLSRVALAEGKHDEANAAVERAGDFGEDTPMAHEPSRYVGAKACAKCHGTIFQAQRNSNHAKTLGWGDALKAIAYPEGPLKDSEDPKVVHRFDASGKEVKTSAEVDGKLIRGVINYVVGSGHHGLSFLAHDESGQRLSLRISSYKGGKVWAMTGGFNPHPTSAKSFLGELLPEDDFRSCLNCHTTQFVSEKDWKGPEVADKGIGCERCHGPGENHLKAVDSGFPQLAIARPKLATHSQRNALCAPCHKADGAIPPSDPRFVRFQSTTLPYSRCMTESGGKLDCMTCHDPHKSLETNAAFYNGRCLNCHGGNALEKAGKPDRAAASRCPVNPKADCTGCHMPKVDNAMPFNSFTDHHIRVLRTEATAKPPRASQ